jgi:hypothetical protein
VYAAGFTLLAGGVLGGFVMLSVETWPGTVALAGSALVLAWCAQFFRKPLLVLAAGGLFFAPVTAAAATWLNQGQVAQTGAWLMTVWAGLALAYLILAAILRRVERYGLWLYILVHTIAPVAGVGLGCVDISA